MFRYSVVCIEGDGIKRPITRSTVIADCDQSAAETSRNLLQRQSLARAKTMADCRYSIQAPRSLSAAATV